MRLILRPILLYLLTLAFLDRILAFVNISNELALIETAVVFWLVNTIAKPFLKILLLPINIITLGLASWLIYVVIVFIVTLVVPGFHIGEATFPAWQIGRYYIPSIHLSVIWTYVFFSFALSFTLSLLDWVLTKRE